MRFPPGSSGGCCLGVQPPSLQFLPCGQPSHLVFKLLMKSKAEINSFFLKVTPMLGSATENTLRRREVKGRVSILLSEI